MNNLERGSFTFNPKNEKTKEELEKGINMLMESLKILGWKGTVESLNGDIQWFMAGEPEPMDKMDSFLKRSEMRVVK